jgi:hypothetical protein
VRNRSRNAPRLLSIASARGLLRAGRGSLVSARKRIEGQRNRHRLVPAIRVRGSGGSLGCARASYPGCRKSASGAEAQEKRVPGGNGPREREPGQRVRKGHVGEKASTTWAAVAKPRLRQRLEPGRPKGHRGAKVLVERKASRAALPQVPLHAAGGGRPRRRLPRQRTREREGPGRKARQGCQKRVRTHGEGKTTPRRHEEKPMVRSAEASLSGVNQEVPRRARASSP